MKKCLTVLASLMIFSCTESGINDIEPHITSISGTWKVKTYEDLVTGVVTKKTDENSWGMDVVITFNETTGRNEVTGYVTTNEMSGEFSYGTNTTLSLSYTVPEINEPEWGKEFHQVF